MAWLAFYATVVIAWGERNSWPPELRFCVLSLPLNVWVIGSILRRAGLQLAIEVEKNQQEQLIAALVLAAGLASGQVFLMSLGLVSLGMAWFRPAGPAVAWGEWLKVPLILLAALPFWLDFISPWLDLTASFEDPAADSRQVLPIARTITHVQVLAYAGWVTMALLLRGRVFWFTLPLLPAALVIAAALSRLAGTGRFSMTPFASPWVLGALAVGGVFVALSPAVHPRLNSARVLREWFKERRYPPWLAVAAVAMMYMRPLEPARFDPGEILGLAGMAVLAGILLGLRLRTPKGPVHSRSVAMVAAGLTLALAGEFTTHEPLRHLALALVTMGLASWHCFWPLRIVLVAIAASLCLLLMPERFPLRLWDPSLLLAVRLSVGFVLLGCLAWLTLKPLPCPGQHGYSDEGWTAPRRFALILLALMMLFQTASAFWPEHEFFPDSPMGAGASNALATENSSHFVRSTMTHRSGPIHISITHPHQDPYLLESPERPLRRRGWRVVEAERVFHPQGEAKVMTLERSGELLATMWWFDWGNRAFVDHQFARRILWSGWHLADRHLRLVHLESSGSKPGELIALARRQVWFGYSAGASDSSAESRRARPAQE
jgi:hypothetical protein